MAKARYRHTPQPATVYPMDGNKAKVIFDAPQRTITPGQSVVLYDDDMRSNSLFFRYVNFEMSHLSFNTREQAAHAIRQLYCDVVQ